MVYCSSCDEKLNKYVVLNYVDSVQENNKTISIRRCTNCETFYLVYEYNGDTIVEESNQAEVYELLRSNNFTIL